MALDPDLPSFLSDPDYSSSSEQSCDTVIYVGPGGAAISDRELSDNEGPPAFVPIIPSLNRKQRGKDGPVDCDHFKCNTFAELQERLECIDGSEEPTAFVVESGENSGSPKIDHGAIKLKEGSSCISVSPKTPTKVLSSTQDSLSKKAISVTSKLPSSPKHKSKLEHSKLQSAAPDKDLRDMCENVCRTSADGEKVQMSESGSLSTTGKQSKTIISQNSEPVVREKVFFNKKLPKPAPPPPQQRDYVRVGSETEEKSATRVPPIGMSHQKRGDSIGNLAVKVHHLNPRTPGEMRSNLRERCMEKDILRTTVTLKQPVELNGEDELVFTLVEELSIGSIVDSGRPSSIVSFNSDCSLQALASGSRPVSIISSINDEFDAYTCSVGNSEANGKMVAPLQERTFASLGSRGSSITSWLSEVSVCTLESDGAQSTDVFLPQGTNTGADRNFYFDSLNMFQSSTQKEPKNSLNDSGCSFSDLESDSVISSKLSLNKCPSSPEAPQVIVKKIPKLEKANTIHISDPQSFQDTQVVQCGLSRQLKPTSSIAQSSSISGSSSSSNWRREPLRQDCIPDPWHRGESLMETSIISNSGSSSRLVRNGISGIPARKAGTSSNSVPRIPKTLGPNPSQRVVDGCEKSCNNRKIEPPSKMPQLRRGATTLGTVPVIQSSIDVKLAQEIVSSMGSLKFSSLGKSGKASKQEESMSKPGNVSPPPPPVRKSSLDQKNRILFPSSALKSAFDAGKFLAPRAAGLEDDIEVRGDSNSLRASNFKSEHSLIKTTSSLKTRGARGDTGQLYGSQISLERCDSLSSLGSKPALSRENSGASLNSKSSKSISRFGSPVATSSPTTTSSPSCVNPVASLKSGMVKGGLNARSIPVNANKARTLSASNSKALSSSTKSLAAPTTRNANLPPSGKTALPRAAAGGAAAGGPGKSTRGTIMGTKQAMRAANSRVSELALTNPSSKQTRGSGDSDSGNDSGVNLNDDKHTPIPILPSPYSKITAPRRPQRYSSGHGSDNSSVLSGELPPAMGRTALFYHSGGSSGYESMIRDSEATGSASSAHDSMSESGMSSSGRTRSSKVPKKRSNGKKYVFFYEETFD